MRVAVMCIGNELLMDEGVGPACARYLLSRYAFPDTVDVLDRAVMGMSIISDLRAYDFVLVLDAVEVPGARPGQVFSFAPDDVAPTPPGMASLHEVRFADVLASAELLGVRCRGHCLGIQVENMSPSEFVVALTPRVAAALPLLAQAAVRYLREELGLAVEDLLASSDPYRAGSGAPGARDFSAVGRRDGESPTAVGDSGDAPQPAVPEVYGDPDATVMARYLAAGLRAVGALAGEGEGEGFSDVSDGAGRLCRVDAVLPADGDDQVRRARDVADRFGLSVAPQAEGAPADRGARDAVRLAAYVSPATTDYDCDALVGACLEVWGEQDSR